MSQHAIAEKFARAIQERDLDALGELMHEDIVSRLPQSGETIHGRSNYLAMLSNYPGLPDVLVSSITGDDKAAVISSSTPFAPPTVTVFGGDRFIVEGRATYSNGETFHSISVLRVQGQFVIEETAYFAPPFEAPEWRRGYVDVD